MKIIRFISILLCLASLFTATFVLTVLAQNPPGTNMQTSPNTIHRAPATNPTHNGCGGCGCQNDPDPDTFLNRLSQEPFSTIINLLLICLSIVLGILAILYTKPAKIGDDPLMSRPLIEGLNWPNIRQTIAGFTTLAEICLFLAVLFIAIPSIADSINPNFGNIIAVPVVIVMGLFILLIARLMNLATE